MGIHLLSVALKEDTKTSETAWLNEVLKYPVVSCFFFLGKKNPEKLHILRFFRLKEQLIWSGKRCSNGEYIKTSVDKTKLFA